MIVLAGSTSKKLAKDLADALQVPYFEVESKIFPDGESYIRIPKFDSNHVILVFSLYYPQDTHLFQALNIINTLKRLGTKNITLLAPYLCYARADRDILGREAISAFTVLSMFEQSGVNHLITMDIHNPDVFSSTNMKTTNLIPVKSLHKYLNEQQIDISRVQVIAPDKGASNRANLVAKELGVPWTALNKSRDPVTGELNMDVGKAKIIGPEALIVDDLSATGSSLIRASNILRIYGIQKIHIFITHLMNPQIIEKLLDSCDGLVLASSSIPSVISKISPLEDLLEVLQ